MTFDNVEHCNLVPTVFSYPSLVGRTATEEGLFNNVVDSHLQVGAPRIQSRSKEGWWGRPRASVWLKNKVGVGAGPPPPPPPPPPPVNPHDITGPWTKKYELVACLSRDYCIKSETDWF